MNKCVHMYIFMKSSFPKDDLQLWYCQCNLDILDWGLTRFGKELFNWKKKPFSSYLPLPSMTGSAVNYLNRIYIYRYKYLYRRVSIHIIRVDYIYPSHINICKQCVLLQWFVQNILIVTFNTFQRQ